MHSTKLPATFTSVYRLFLRTCSASVLHHKTATINLRQLWRPTFVAAAKITRELQYQSTVSRKEKEDWLREWERSIDNTLALLYNSCKTRGLPHRLTRNLGFLVLSEHQRLRDQHRNLKAWMAHLPPTSPLYQPPQKPSSKELKKAEKLARLQAFKEVAWEPLSQVVRLAEGRHSISLGRIVINKPVWHKRK